MRGSTPKKRRRRRSTIALCHRRYTRVVNVAVHTLQVESHLAVDEESWGTRLWSRFRRKTTPPCTWWCWRRRRSWRAPPGSRKEVLLCGAWTKSTRARCSSTLSGYLSLCRGPERDGQRFAHLTSTIHTSVGQEGCDRRMEASRMADRRQSGVLLPKIWQLFSHFSLGSPRWERSFNRRGEKISSGLRRHGMEAAQYRRKQCDSSSGNHGWRKPTTRRGSFGNAVPRRVEHVGYGARGQHETDNWLTRSQ